MNDLPDVVVLSATRTAIGRHGGGLASVPPCDLAATVVREAVSRAGVEPANVGHAVFGNVIHTEIRDMYLGRVAAVNGGLPITTPVVHVEPAVRQRAAAAAQAGYFEEQITPVQAPARKGTVEVVADEPSRPNVTADDLARLHPAFTDDGTVTAGNASGVNDAAAAVMLASAGDQGG
jgi:acetyl-CoA acetyltransferase